MLNLHPPPSRRFFDGLSLRGAAGPIGIDIGGWPYRFQGLDGTLREDLAERYRTFTVPPEGEDRFEVRALDGRVDQFVPPDAGGGGRSHPLSLGWEGGLLLVRSYGFAGWISLGERHGEMALARGGFEKGLWCVENFLRVCTAWRAFEEGGVLLHAASLVRRGSAYLFMGASGSGKSTLAAISREGKVLSDDLSLVRRLPEGFRVAGTPFRGTYQGGEPIRGFFPVGGIYRIFKAGVNRVEACPPSNAVADLLAASPFVVDQIARRPEILDHLRDLNEAHPVAYLQFNLQGDFWDLLPGDRRPIQGVDPASP